MYGRTRCRSHEKKKTGRSGIVEKIQEYERKGFFDRDVEDDPPTVPLDYKKLDLLHKKLSSKIKCWWAYRMGLGWVKGVKKSGMAQCGEVRGLENLAGLTGGAIVTCNHINQVDSFVLLWGLQKHFRDLKNNRLFKVVREGNYNQPAFLGFIMRNCDTLPVNEESSRNLRVTAKTMEAIKVLLPRGKKILIYPEQAMWWNYRKPRPLKNGAYAIAAKNNAPIIPCFITMRDTDKVADGFPVQEFTLNIAPVIYPDPNLTVKENTEKMRDKNAVAWREIYEKTYGVKLEYLTARTEKKGTAK